MTLPNLEIRSRAEWDARPPKWRHHIAPANMPTVELWQHHTVSDYRGAAGIRAIQNFHMDGRGWSDIAYSFIIDRRNLEVYEGRGPGIVGGHTKGRNRYSHAIAVTGNFELYQPPDALLRVIAALVAYGHRQHWWTAPRITGGHRDAPGANTACPGKYLYLAIPRINAYAQQREPTMQERHIERIERVLAELGYTVDIDRELDEREAKAVENMGEGIHNLIARNQDLERQVADLKQGRPITPATLAKVGEIVGAMEIAGESERNQAVELEALAQELMGLFSQSDQGDGGTDT